jgi:hypothetical protein
MKELGLGERGIVSRIGFVEGPNAREGVATRIARAA